MGGCGWYFQSFTPSYSREWSRSLKWFNLCYIITVVLLLRIFHNILSRVTKVVLSLWSNFLLNSWKSLLYSDCPCYRTWRFVICSKSQPLFVTQFILTVLSSVLGSAKRALPVILFNQNCVQQSPEVCWLQCYGHRPYVITHFRAFVLTSHDLLRQIRIRSCGWWASIPLSLAVGQITELSQAVLFSKCGWLRLCLMTWGSPSSIKMLLTSKRVCSLLKINIHALYVVWGYSVLFCYWYFIQVFGRI